MKTKELNKYMLLFDAECPICNWAADIGMANKAAPAIFGGNSLPGY